MCPRRVVARTTDPMTGLFALRRSALDVAAVAEQAIGFKVLLAILVIRPQLPAARVSRAVRIGGLALLMAAVAYVVVGDAWRALPAPLTGAAGAPVNSLAEVVVEVGARLHTLHGLGVGAETVLSAVTVVSALLMVMVLVVGAVTAFQRGSLRAAVDPAVVTLLAACVVAPDHGRGTRCGHCCWLPSSGDWSLS